VFLLNGQPFNYVSGSIHYFRVPHPYWRDRLQKLRQAGFNTVQTYIPWNAVEPYPGSFNADGQSDYCEFIRVAAEEGLFVILRPGPYICAEVEGGGLPWWLSTASKNITVRTSDPVYLKFVEKYFNFLLPTLVPLLYKNGGPVIMVQVENEYGSAPVCDKEYMPFLRDLLWRHLGRETVLFTTDPFMHLDCGRVDGALATIDFGPQPDMSTPFQELRKFQPTGPLVNSEFYPGWFDLWGFKHSTVPAKEVASSLAQLLNNKSISVNMYVFHGGSNFGFSAGGKPDPFGGYRPVPTSYDFDAPLSEAGDMTEKYQVLKEVLNGTDLIYFGSMAAGDSGQPRSARAITNSTKEAYGVVKINYVSSLFNSRS
jgi:beta-galactosidase